MAQIETITISVAETVLNKTFKQAVSPILVTQENVKGTPPTPDTTEEYIAFTVNFGTANKSAISPRQLGQRQNIYTRSGIATAQIFTPLGVGTGRALEIATLINDAFQDVEFPGRCLTIVSVSVTKIGPSGSYYQTNVDIAFQHFETK